MTISVVQSTALTKVAGGSSIAFSLSSVGASNALAITIAYGAASTNTAQATYPSNWIVTSIKSEGGGGRADVAVLPGSFVAGGSESATLTFPSGTYATGEMHEISGLDPTSPLDLQLTIANTTATITPTAVNHTTAQASEILIGVAASDPYYGSGTQTCAQPVGYTQLWQETDANTNAVGVGAYEILSAITTVADAWSVPSGSYNYAVTVSLKAASSSTNSANLSASVAPTFAGTALAYNFAHAAGSITPTFAGTAVQVGTNFAHASGIVALAFNGTALAHNAAALQASVDPTFGGTAQARLHAALEAAVTPTYQGTALGRAYASLAASVSPTVQATAYARNFARLQASVQPEFAGSAFQGVNFAHLQASVTPTASSTALARNFAYASGIVQLGFTGVVFEFDPNFLAQASAPSYETANPLAFYVQAPPNSYLA